MNLQIARDIIQNAGRLWNFRIARQSHWFKAHAAESIDRVVRAQTMLQRQTKRAAKTLYETRKRGAFFAHLDKNFTRAAVMKKTNGEVALMSRNAELVRLTSAGFRQNFAAG